MSIVATGARTPVGQNSAATAAAVRAGISRLAEHPFMIDQVGDPMSAGLDPCLDPALFGYQRFVALARNALQEACRPIRAFASGLHAPLYLALPEFRPGFNEEDAAAIGTDIGHIASLLQVSKVDVFTQGHAAGLAAIKKATEMIQQGEVEACLVGGVDSYFHPDTMEWLDGARQLAGAVSRSGFVPGEGAGFCWLMSEVTARNNGLRPLARVVSAATGRETKLIRTSDVCLGEGLTVTVREAMRDMEVSVQAITDIFCDMNSERYRGDEWGFVCLRLPRHFTDPTGYVSPADSWGDMGAASAPLLATLACEANARGYARGPRTLLWASSEGGLRGAAVLEFEERGTDLMRGVCHVA